MPRNTIPVPGTETDPVYLTPVEIGLLGDIGDPEIDVYGRFSVEYGTTVYRIQRAKTSPIKNVTNRVTKLINLGLAQRGQKDSPAAEARFPVKLTQTGIDHLKELADAA